MGLLGRVWKDVAKHATSESDRIESLRHSRECYARGLAEAETAGDPGGYYPGINAASLSIQLGEREVALDFARRTEACVNRCTQRDYWAVATLAEIALIRGDAEGARRFYSEAVAFHPAPEKMSVRASSGRIFNMGLHPHVTGQPHRIRALREFLQYAKRFPDLWWTTREEIATWYLANHRTHIS